MKKSIAGSIWPNHNKDYRRYFVCIKLCYFHDKWKIRTFPFRIRLEDYRHRINSKEPCSSNLGKTL